MRPPPPRRHTSRCHRARCEKRSWRKIESTILYISPAAVAVVVCGRRCAPCGRRERRREEQGRKRMDGWLAAWGGDHRRAPVRTTSRSRRVPLGATKNASPRSTRAFGTMSSQGSEASHQVFGSDENMDAEEEQIEDGEEVEEEEECGCDGSKQSVKHVEEEEECECGSDGSERSVKRHKPSDIWEGFWILRRHGSSAACSACKRILAKSSKSGISLLRSLYSDDSHPDFEAARRAIAMFFISSGESLSLNENEHFQQLAHHLNPMFPICHTNLCIDVMNLYERERNTLKHIIAEALGGLSFSVDHWKSKATGDKSIDDNCVCVTACFVDADWNLQRRVVGFKLLRTDDNLSVEEKISLCFDDLLLGTLNFDRKIMGITFDNTLDDPSVANSLKKLLRDEGNIKFFFDGEFCHLHCCAEILNGAVQAGLELIADFIEKIRHGIRYINYCAIRKDKFYRSAKDTFHLDVKIKLHDDVVGYWDQTYKMLGCALYYKDALNDFASTDETFLSHFHLDDKEWNKVATMEKFLKVIYDITCIFLSKQPKTASIYIVGVYKVYRLLDITKWQGSFMSAMVEKIKAKFDKYWTEYSLILACAAVLYPRYKLNLISYCFRKIHGDADASQHVERVVALLKKLFAEYEKPSCSSSVGKNVLECHTKDELFDDYSPPEQMSELDWYLGSPVMDLNVDLDILKFWSGMSSCYPNLATLACDILAIPISTVATKSVFTMGEKILNRRRSGVEPYLLMELICLHDWTCPKDRNGITVFSIEWYCADDEEEEDDEVEMSIEESNDGNYHGASCSSGDWLCTLHRAVATVGTGIVHCVRLSRYHPLSDGASSTQPPAPPAQARRRGALLHRRPPQPSSAAPVAVSSCAARPSGALPQRSPVPPAASSIALPLRAPPIRPCPVRGPKRSGGAD
ncbi:hypothetical protein U9M48_031097 [Paspalum notatum var. saurae]|uniref:Uncharacterized protein n=1 Tax=Paspalum notatum var. saurae TaxID=547442 RepID=A0AAQ3X2Z9_PASNO